MSSRTPHLAETAASNPAFGDIGPPFHLENSMLFALHILVPRKRVSQPSPSTQNQSPFSAYMRASMHMTAPIGRAVLAEFSIPVFWAIMRERSTISLPNPRRKILFALSVLVQRPRRAAIPHQRGH
jgi:hypothetical protein